MSDATTTGVVNTLTDQLNKPGDDSKKYKLLMRGLYGIVLVFVLAGVAVLVKPELAAPLSQLGQIVVIALGGVVSVGCGSIAAVDFKNSGSLAQVVQAQINK